MDGKTDAATPLRTYRIANEYSVLSSDSLLSFSVRILRNGNLVEISVVASLALSLSFPLSFLSLSLSFTPLFKISRD